MFSDHAVDFAGLKVIEFEGSESWEGPKVAYRVRGEHEEDDFYPKLDGLLAMKEASELEALVIGAWDAAFDQGGSDEIVERLVKNAGNLRRLRALFLGDIVYEECELSWIKQADMAPILNAYPALESLRVRGSEGLAFSPLRHEGLKTLIVESGGLPRALLRQIFLCEFPNLEHIELLLGEANYGWDGDVEDLQPLLSGRLYPRLRYLGLKDSEVQDEIVAAVVNSPLVRRIKTLDLSQGLLTERGARSLLHLPADGTLECVDISYHYVPEEIVNDVRKKLPCKLIADDPQDPNEEFRSILHAE